MHINNSKTIIVSGGTKGIGRAIIEKFAQNAFNIITCSRDKKELEELKDRMRDSYDIDFFYQEVDVSKKQEVINFGNFILEHSSNIAVLVNNAGIFFPDTIQHANEGNLEMAIETNLYSAYYLSKMILPTMVKNKSGHIFNMCSVASKMPYLNGTSYGISKFAMLGFSQSLREEMKNTGVRVTSILPGATMSASWVGTDLPEERFMKSADVADCLYNAYQLSDRAVVEEITLRPQLGDI